MKIKTFVIPLLLSILGVSASAHQGHHETEKEEVSTAALNGESVYNLSSTWTNQDGKNVKLDTLKGEPVVAAMLYTSCTGACPMTVSNLKSIEGALAPAQRSKVRFAVFSFDSDRDTPSKLKTFAEKRKLDLNRWSLFHGDISAVRKLAAVLGIKYKKDKAGDFDHSNAISILDSSGVLVFQQMGLKNEPQEPAAKLSDLLKPGE